MNTLVVKCNCGTLLEVDYFTVTHLGGDNLKIEASVGTCERCEFDQYERGQNNCGQNHFEENPWAV